MLRGLMLLPSCSQVEQGCELAVIKFMMLKSVTMPTYCYRSINYYLEKVLHLRNLSKQSRILRPKQGVNTKFIFSCKATD